MLNVREKTIGVVLGVAVAGISAAADQQITLGSNWNAIGFSGVPDSQDIESIVTNSGSISVVEEVQGGGKVWKASNPALFNTLKRIDPHMGYYVKSSSSDDVVMNVPIGTSTEALYGHLKADAWSMIAIPVTTLEPQSYVDNSLNAGSTVVEIQGGGKVWKSTNPALFNTLTTMAAGTGYWVKVTNTTSPAAEMQDAEAASTSEAQVSSLTAPDGKALRVLVPAVKTSIGTQAVQVEEGEDPYQIPALPVAVYAKSAADNDTSAIVDSAYADGQVVLQLTDSTGAVTYTTISALDSAGGVNAAGTSDDSGQAGTFE